MRSPLEPTALTFSFYIDESGHSGDAVKSGIAYDFLDQPFFVLAAIGLEDESKLVKQVETLKVKHSVPAGELKSKSLQSKHAFIVDLLAYVSNEDLPVFIEVVDKKYFVCIHLVNSQLLPPVMGFENGPGLHFIKNVLVDFLYDEITDHVLDRFVGSCVTPSDQSLMSSFGSQLLFSAEKSATKDAQDIRDGMHKMVLAATKAYGEMRKADPEAYLRFIPSPDLNKRNKPVWMLPNLSSFTNLYARINLYRQGKLASIRLVHDQQLELNDILRDAKRTAESLKDWVAEPFTPYSDYVFNETASLEFATSHESIGIQVADILAGTVMRFYRDRLRGSESAGSELGQAVRRLIEKSDPSTGYGINQVVPLRLVM